MITISGRKYVLTTQIIEYFLPIPVGRVLSLCPSNIRYSNPFHNLNDLNANFPW